MIFVLLKKVSRTGPLILALVFGMSAPAWGIKILSKQSGGEGQDIPVHITAEKMEVDHASQQIRFIGNVVSVRGGMVIRSDVLDVLKARSEEGEGQIEKIIARGNVQFENETKRATGKEAVYLANERKVVLTGDARAWEGENEVSGNQMTIFLDEDKSIVESGAGQRVEVYIKSQGNGQSSFVNLGQERTSETEKEASPIFVTADRMEADHEQKTVYFEGKVKTKRADFRMDSDELEVFDSGQDTSRISKIIARGNVRLDRGGKVATGDKAIYYERDRKFLLTGNAKAWESQNIVAGSRMEIYLDEDKSVVLGDGKEQVEVTIYPNEAPTSKQPLPQPSLSVGEKKFD